MIALLPEFPDWTAVVTGRVTVEHQAFARELERRVAEAGLADRIVFLGEVPDIKLWYRRLSLYVAPSRNEGFGLTPLEAMASGSPVVASDAGAYADLIAEGETGYVVAGRRWRRADARRSAPTCPTRRCWKRTAPTRLPTCASAFRWKARRRRSARSTRALGGK